MSEMKHSPNAGGYEKKDVNVAKIAVFTIALIAAFGLAGYLIPYFLFKTMNEEGQRADSAPPLYQADQLPSGPRLQVKEARDLREKLDAEKSLLGTTAWVDRDNGVVRIPIERAMDLIAQRGLPQRPDVKEEAVAAAAKDSGTAKQPEQRTQP
jgi:hypothetical protein